MIIISIFYMCSQNKKDMELLIFFKDGIITETTSVYGKNVKKIKIDKASIRKTIEMLSISEDSIQAAYPDFKQSDTLKALQNGLIINRLDMSKLCKIPLKAGSDITKVLDELRKDPDVLYAEINHSVKPEFSPNDNYFSSQWNLYDEFYKHDIHIKNVWDIYKGSTNNIIAIIDGGVLTTHPDLKNKIAGGDSGIGSGDWLDHGTLVSGIAAETNNNIGVAGIDIYAKILPKRMDTGGTVQAAQAISSAVDFSPNVFVLNNSWSIYDSNGQVDTGSTTVREAIAYAYKNNRVIIAAMGNHQISQPNITAYPAGYSHVIAVGATDRFAAIWNKSAQGSHIDICAPGVQVATTSNTSAVSYTVSATGTSIAAPHVSGVVSLMKGYKSNLANDDIENIIKLSTDKVAGMNGVDFTPTYGYGIINAEKAFKYLQPPYKIIQKSVGNGTPISTSGKEKYAFFIPSLSGYFFVQRIEIQKTVPLPQNITNIVGAWGRGAFSIGASPENPNYGEGFCEVIPGSITSTTLTLRSYVFRVYDMYDTPLGYYPCAPENAVMAYTVLATSNGLSDIYTQDVYIQNETISSNKHTYGKDFYIGNNVSTSLPSGNVTINLGANVLTEGQTLTISSGFECINGSSFEFRNLEPM